MTRISIQPMIFDGELKAGTYNFEPIKDIEEIPQDYDTITRFAKMKTIELKTDLKDKQIFKMENWLSGIIKYDNIIKNYNFDGTPLFIPITDYCQFFILHNSTPSYLYLWASRKIMISIKRRLGRLFSSAFGIDLFRYYLPRDNVVNLRNSLDIETNRTKFKTNQTDVIEYTLKGVNPDRSALNDSIIGTNELISFDGEVLPRSGTKRWKISISEDGGIYTQNKVSMRELIDFHYNEILPHLIRKSSPLSPKEDYEME